MEKTLQGSLFADRLYQKWKDFDRDNPKVWTLFERFALEAATAGREHFGGQMVWERMRWYVMIETNDEDYKLNNDYVAYYSRMFNAKYPQFGGGQFFRTRRVAHDNA
jgi:hypothetical protein